MILQIAASVSVFVIGLVVLKILNNSAIKKFNFSLVTIASFIMAAISLGLIFIGYDWYANLVLKNEDIMNGLVVLALGVIVGLILIFSNISKTNIIYAVSGLLVQFLIMGALYYLFVSVRTLLSAT